jgi:hypothetical protein
MTRLSGDAANIAGQEVHVVIPALRAVIGDAACRGRGNTPLHFPCCLRIPSRVKG